MRALLVGALALGALASGPAAGQDKAAREARCWIGSSTFSVGATMFVGQSVAVCDASGAWMASDESLSAAGCLLEGKLSSAGAVVGVRNSEAMLLECGADGQWADRQAAPGN